jgi:cyclophilin family peptidyl-prolyl cis-trans isomerase/HEAT repeat protein
MIYMRIKHLPIFIILLFLSCQTDRDQEIIAEIRNMEFSRTFDFDIIKKYAQDRNPNVRLQVAKSIGRVQDSLYVANLINLLDDQDERVVNETIFALGQIVCKETEKLLSKLFTNEKYSMHRSRIVEALSKMEGTETDKILLDYLNIAPDSIKSLLIERFAVDKSTAKIKRRLNTTIESFLSDSNHTVKYKAAYYFSRNPSRLAIESLIKTKFNINSLGNKYRLKSLIPVIKNLYQQFADSTLIDSMQTSLRESIENPHLPWQIKLYMIPTYLYEGDSTDINICKQLLMHKNPHIRLQTIFSLGKLSSDFAENLLLEFYNLASWSDKGAVIETLALKNSWLAHRLIQQNLDQGNTNFKIKLLRALAKIPHRSARRQLKQFLKVPNQRLQYTAFAELNKLGLLNSKDIVSVLQAGDVALTSLAAEWILKHPNKNYVQALIQVYTKFKEPKDNEAMFVILKALRKIKSKESIPFLMQVIQNSSQALLFDQASLILNEMNIEKPIKNRPTPKLFIPDTMVVDEDEIYATIITERGDIRLKLWPNEAPVTVSNFKFLAKKGFYKNLTFHRVVSDFVVQGGDPRGDGWGGPGYQIPCEYNTKPFIRGSLGMATSGKDTAGSQFFICHSEQPHLNGRYTLFGEVVDGMDVVDMIEIDDKIIDISIND